MLTFPFRALLCVAAIYYNGIAGQNPCEDHTVVKDAYKRSVRYQATGSADDPLQCDRYESEGWYRFEGRQGDEMPTYAPTRPACGTSYPIWLNGTLPAIEDGVVDRTACTVNMYGNCSASYNIKVVNCEALGYVYYLRPTLSCPEAYCMGSEIQCPEGTGSENGFTPNCTSEGYVNVTTTPYITFRVGEHDYSTGIKCDPDKQVIMQCNILHDEPQTTWDVAWYIGEENIKENIGENSIPYSELPAELRESEWADPFKGGQLDQNISCVMRARYHPASVPSKHISATYYMGFDVKGQFLTVKEGGEPSNYSVRPTIPILCGKDWDIEPYCECGVQLEVFEPIFQGPNGEPTSTCDTGKPLMRQTIIKISDVGQSNCGLLIKEDLNPGPDSWYHLPVYATTDNVYDGDHQILLEIRTTERIPIHPIWQDYHLPTASVAVLDTDISLQGELCTARNDPHMMTFDGRCYENQLAGEFIMYRHTYLPIDVHAYFSEQSKYSAVCGVAVRAGGDLFIYDNCPGSSSGRVRIYECEEMSLIVTQIDEYTYDISLPTGGLVRVGKSYIEIHPSPQDVNKTAGICGTLTGRCDDDFFFRDGTYYEVDEARKGCDRTAPGVACSTYSFYPNEWSEDWRVPESESLFKGIINDNGRFGSALFCYCDDETQQTLCSYTEDMYQFCIDEAAIDFEKCYEQEENRKLFGVTYSDDVEDEVEMFEYDKDFQAPESAWSDGWTSETAKANCELYFNATPAVSTCLGVSGVDFNTAVADCMLDIKISKNSSFNMIHLGAILSSCEKELKRNQSLYTFNNETGLSEPPTEMLEQICESDCHRQGDCIEGICYCHDGFGGESCGLNLNQIPNIRDLPEGGFCDLETRPCVESPVQGEYFINTPNLTCLLKPTQVTLEGAILVEEDIYVAAKYEHLKRVFCPIPKLNLGRHDVLATGFKISVSNNRVDYSNEVQLTVQDSLCMNCTVDLECQMKNTACFIDGKCFADGETSGTTILKRLAKSNPEPSCQVCDPSQDMYDWSYTQSEECNPSNKDGGSGWIIGGSVLLLACCAGIIGFGAVMYRKRSNKVHATESDEIEADTKSEVELITT